MENVNLAKVYKEYYSAKAKPSCFTAGAGKFLACSGKGDPGGADFGERVTALYGVAYGLRAVYKSRGKLFTVPKLEGFWWADDDSVIGEEFLKIPRSEWNSKLLIRMPDFVDLGDVDGVIDAVAKKKTERAKDVHGEIIDQGLAAHIMHVGPFAEETATINILDGWLNQAGIKKTGRHHEIYISDFRKVDPQKMKTIIMYQVQPPA